MNLHRRRKPLPIARRLTTPDLAVILLVIPVALGGCSREPAAARGGADLVIYLARHGRTEWNARKKLQGGTDVPLDEVGREQARALSERLEGVPLDAIYSSVLERSRATADAVAAGRTVTALAGLNEQSLGKFEGAEDGPDDALRAEFRERRADPDDRLDGGESRNDHLARVRATIDEIGRRHAQGGTILVVGHGGTNSHVLRVLLELDADEASRIHQENDELYRIDLGAGRPPALWKLITRDRLDEL